jgi:hypothetical protein
MYIGWGLMPLTGQRGDAVKPPKNGFKEFFVLLWYLFATKLGVKKLH